MSPANDDREPEARGRRADVSPGRASERRYVPIAEIGRPHGLRGEVRARPYNPGSDLLLRRPPIRLRLADGSDREATIAGARGVNGAVLLKLEGADDRSAAEALRGAVVCVDRRRLPPAEEGEFYACDLEGARVELASGEAIGTVRTVTSYPTCDVLVVDRAQGGTLEVPLVDDYVASIDVEHGLVRVVDIDRLG